MEFGRCLVAQSDVGFDEDERHEFKSHRSLAVEEVPRWCTVEQRNKVKRSRQPVSKTVCAFLNSGEGGVVYLGVSDAGKVVGLKMTCYQRQHLFASLSDTLARFSPSAVDVGRVGVTLRPVVARADSAFKPDEPFESEARRPHLLRTADFCWCDDDALAQFNLNLIPPSYVVELRVRPFKGDAGRLAPIFQNEEGLSYVRRQGSNISISLNDVFQMTQSELSVRFKIQTKLLREKRDKLVQTLKSSVQNA